MNNEYRVSKPTSFMRLYPDVKSEVTDELLYGTSVTLMDESYAGYVYCVTDYGYRGYVDISDLSQKKQSGTRFVVKSQFCDIYEYPEYRFAPVLTLPKGSIIEGTVFEKNCGKFTGVEIDGKMYYTPTCCVRAESEQSSFDNEAKKRNSIVKTAFSYLGTPYRWGGKSPSGIDCSGLCFMSYALCGIGLYRDAEFDRRYVKEVGFEDLKVADLIYYNGHMTMYIGGGEYIHSSATLGGVKIGSFDENDEKFYPKLKNDIICCGRSLIF